MPTTFNGFDLQTSNYITERIENGKSYAEVRVKKAEIARNAGDKLFGREFGNKRIRLQGHIIGSSQADLLAKVDDFQKNLNTNDRNLLRALVLTTNRTYYAYVSDLRISDEHYSQSYVPFEVEFVAPDGFAYGPANTLVVTIASGTRTGVIPMTISGTVFSLPKFTLLFNGQSAGDTTVSGIAVEHITGGQTVTISGISTNRGFNYNVPLVFTYSGMQVTLSGLQTNFTGQLDRFEPGGHLVQITVGSGTNPGVQITVEWQDRYF